MYKTNSRTISFDSSEGTALIQKCLITKEDYINSTDKIVLENTPYAIAKRIFNGIDIDVLVSKEKNEWMHVDNSDYAALEIAYEDRVELIDNDGYEPIDNFSPTEPVIETHKEPIAQEIIEPEEKEQIEETVETDPVDSIPDEIVLNGDTVKDEVKEEQPQIITVNPNTQNNNYRVNNNKRNKHNNRR